MPHVIIKLWPGPSEAQKSELAQAIVRDIAATIGSGPDSVSVAIEEVRPGDWMEQVYRRDIAPTLDRLYKQPGYEPF